MNAKKQYRCGVCYACYKDSQDADECCPTEVTKVWVCGKCRLVWEEEKEAEECCKEEGGEEGPSGE